MEFFLVVGTEIQERERERERERESLEPGVVARVFGTGSGGQSVEKKKARQTKSKVKQELKS